MRKYNKGTRRLITVIKKEIEKLREEVLDKTTDAIQERRNSNIKLALKEGIGFFDTNSCTKEAEQKFVDETLEKYDNVLAFIQFMQSTLITIEKRTMFRSFEDLEFLFKYTNFPKELQMDVLAYLLKNNAKAAVETYNEFQEKVKEQGEHVDYYQLLQHKIEDLVEAIDHRISVDEFKKTVSSEEYPKHVKEIVENYKIVGEYINDNYEFVGSYDLNRLYDAIKVIDILRLTSTQTKMIIYAVSEKQIAELNIQYTEDIKREQKNEFVSKNNQSSIEYGKLRKEENIAVQQLKEFLSEDQPIKFINVEDLVKIMFLLKKANYPDERILKIQKNISKSNDEYMQEELLNKLNESKQKYLTVEEIDILQAAESKIMDPDACKNPFFNSIKDNYDFIKAELLKMVKAEADDPEIIELIKVAITEIQETMMNYMYSDYRVTLELTKKED